MVARQDVGNGDGPQQPGEGGRLSGAAERPGEPRAGAAPRSVSFPAGASSAESSGARLRETPVPPTSLTAQSCAGASPAAPGAGSSRGGLWENSWRMRRDKHLKLVPSRMPSVRAG